MRREPLHPGAQQTLFPSIQFRYWGHYTDNPDGDAVTLDTHMRAHAHVEDLSAEELEASKTPAATGSRSATSTPIAPGSAILTAYQHIAALC